MVSLTFILSILLIHMVNSCLVHVHPDVWSSTISRKHERRHHCWYVAPAVMSPLCELISPLFHSVFDSFACSRWRCLTSFEGVVKHMFIISANRPNMFGEGNALPSSIRCRFMGSFKFSQVAATSHSVTMKTKRGRRCCGRVTCFKEL